MYKSSIVWLKYGIKFKNSNLHFSGVAYKVTKTCPDGVVIIGTCPSFIWGKINTKEYALFKNVIKIWWINWKKSKMWYVQTLYIPLCVDGKQLSFFRVSKKSSVLNPQMLKKSSKSAAAFLTTTSWPNMQTHEQPFQYLQEGVVTHTKNGK